MYAHADLELQWLLLLFGETRVISVLGSQQIWIKCRFPWIMTVTTTLLFRQRGLCQQCRPRSDVTLRIVFSGSTLFYTYPAMFRQIVGSIMALLKK